MGRVAGGGQRDTGGWRPPTKAGVPDAVGTKQESVCVESSISSHSLVSTFKTTNRLLKFLVVDTCTYKHKIN